MNILLWHVHGSWTTSFVHGKLYHQKTLPKLTDIIGGKVELK